MLLAQSGLAADLAVVGGRHSLLFASGHNPRASLLWDTQLVPVLFKDQGALTGIRKPILCRGSLVTVGYLSQQEPED